VSPSHLLLRSASERFRTRLDWLDSRHSFSFAEHHDPAWMGFGPLRVINDDTIAPGQGFGLHPHRNMEIITVVVAGRIDHGDSMGHQQVLRAGDVQRMSAGSGLLHSEINGGDQPCRMLQIWIEPSQPGLPPSYEQRPFAVGPHWSCLVAPAGSDGALTIGAPVRLWRARPEAGGRLPLPLAPGSRGWIQLIEGDLEFSPAAGQDTGTDAGSLPLQAGDGLGLAAGSIGSLVAGPGGADLLLFELPAT
jgi:hypothetical protein